MNTRCYRCGWSFSLSREAIEEAAVNSAGQKAHVIHCPRCRQAIRIPMDQIMRALPPGWAPPAKVGDQAAAAEQAAAETAAGPEPTSEVAEPAQPSQRRPERRHRHASKTNSGDSAAVPAAKKGTHPT
jgi:hypothetical protein